MGPKNIDRLVRKCSAFRHANKRNHIWNFYLLAEGEKLRSLLSGWEDLADDCKS